MAELLPTHCPLQNVCTNFRKGFDGPMGESVKSFVKDTTAQVVANVDAVKGCIATEPRRCTFDTQANNLVDDPTTAAIIFSTTMSIGFEITGRGGENEGWRTMYLPSDIDTPEKAAEFLHGNKQDTMLEEK